MEKKLDSIHLKGALAMAITAAVTFSCAALAQDDKLEEIHVTGTRIRMTNGMAEPTPVTSITPTDLSTFEPGGTIADQLEALPQFFNSGSAQRGGPALFSDGGGSYLDMRGLGRNRTLVLLDGSRVAPADKRGNVNVDNFPNALVRSVDIVTGGASAAYGADALGGVTNFVLDREFQGFKASVSTGMNEFNNDGKNLNFSLAGGRQFGDRLNVIGSLEARTIDEIDRGAREMDGDWFKNYGYITNPAYKVTDTRGTNVQRITVPWATGITSNATGIIYAPGTPLHGLTFNDDGNGIRPFVKGDISDTSVTSGGPEADRNLDTRSVITGSAVDNRSGFLGLKYDVSDTFSVFGQALVGRTESSSLGEHSTFTSGGAGNSAYNMEIFRSNPYIPADVAAIMDARGMTSFKLSKGGSDFGKLATGVHEEGKTVFTTSSWQVGFDAVLPNGWDLRASWQTGESVKRGGEYRGSRVDREALSRDAVRDPATGAIVCNVTLHNPTLAQLAAAPEVQGLFSSRDGVTPLASPIGLDNSVRDCVPYNAMGEEGMSYAAWDYIHTPKISDSSVEQDFAEALVTGELYEGWGYGPLSFAGGLTYREQSFSDQAVPAEVDALGPPLNVPSLGIRGIAPNYGARSAASNLHQFSTINKLSGEYDVWEWFTELQVPIWESGSGNQRVGGTLAYRSSDYSSSGRSESWKVGLEIQPYEDLRLRLTKSRDVREASSAERFDAQTGGAFVNDPWTGASNDNPTVASGGNPTLRPEIANTNVAGFVYQPSFLDGFSASVDWYDVAITDAVATLTAQNMVDGCFKSNSYCDKVIRDATGYIIRINAGYLNLAQSTVRGIDYELAYNVEPNFFNSQTESFGIRAIVGHLSERHDISSTGGVTAYETGYNNPNNNGNLTANYRVGPWSIQWQQVFVDESKMFTTWDEGIDIDDNSVPFYTWTNSRLSYTGDMSNGGNWSVSFNVTNIFNKDPPLILLSTGQTVVSDYDQYGRRYQLSANMNF